MYTYQNVEVLLDSPRVLFHGDLYGSEPRNCDSSYLWDLIRKHGIKSTNDFEKVLDTVKPSSEKGIGDSCTLIDILASSFKVEPLLEGKMVHLYLDEELTRQAWEALRDTVDTLY